MEKTLVVGLWGFPGNWYRARYKPVVVDDIKSVDRLSSWTTSRESISAHSTTIVLAKTFRDKGFETHLKIYGLDTLASPPRLDSNKIRKNGDRERADLVDELNRYLNEFAMHDPKSYGDVVERAEMVLKLFVDGYTKLVDDSLSKKLSSISISILPGIGTFDLVYSNTSKRYVYRGSPLNTYAALFLDLVETLEFVDPDIVLLDVSHGINYLPVLGREAVYRCVEFFSSVKRKRVVVAIFNSDPVNEQDQESYIHLIELKQFSAAPIELIRSFAEVLTREFPKLRMLEHEKPSDMLNNVNRYVEEVCEKHIGLLNAIAKASSYGLVLYIAHKLFELDLNLLKSHVENLRNKILEAIKNRNVSRENNTILIKHNFAIPTTIIDLLNAMHLLMEISKNIKTIETTKEDDTTFIEINMLKKLAKDVGLSEIAKTILESEIDNIEKHIATLTKIGIDIDLSKPTPLSAVMELIEKPMKNEIQQILDKAKKKKCTIDKRNFYAHAGLERNTVEILTKNNRILIGYSTKCLEKIDNIITKT